MTLPDLAQSWAAGVPRPDRIGAVALPPGVGDLTVLADAETAAATTAELDGDLLRIRMPAGGARTLNVTVAAADPIAIWRPASDQNRGRLAPSWSAPQRTGPFDGPALGVLVGRGDTALFGYSVESGAQRVAVRAGMVEETARFTLTLECEEGDAVDLVLDLGGGRFAEAVRRLGAEAGLGRDAVDDRNREPVYCTWYSFHQDLAPEALVAEAALAAGFGFATVIVDDGWQNADTDRGYGSCGDWEVDAAKIGDGRALVERLAALGLSTLWWIGTPWVGHRSAAFREGRYDLLRDEPGMGAAVLDPRSERSRAALVARLDALLRDTGAAGLKLDFLECFASAADGGLILLDELRALFPEGAEPMIEFREPYLSTAALPRGSMIRVGDCPLSPAVNRAGILDLRLATHGIAVHADPIMWGDDDTDERVAQHLVNALFGVPQVSVLLGALSAGHAAVLRHWLGFWREHRDVLLGPDLDVTGVDRGYARATARDADTVITATYADDPLDLPRGAWSAWHIVNGGDAGVVVRGGSGVFDVLVRDARGGLVDEFDGIPLALAELPVPTGGRAEVRRS